MLKEGNYREEKGGEMFRGSLVMLIIVKCQPGVKEKRNEWWAHVSIVHPVTILCISYRCIYIQAECVTSL